MTFSWWHTGDAEASLVTTDGVISLLLSEWDHHTTRSGHTVTTYLENQEVHACFFFPQMLHCITSLGFLLFLWSLGVFIYLFVCLFIN